MAQALTIPAHVHRLIAGRDTGHNAFLVNLSASEAVAKFHGVLLFLILCGHSIA